MSNLEKIKTAVQIAVMLSTTFTVSNAIRNNVVPQSKLQAAELWVGSAVIGALAAEKAVRYVDLSIDTVAHSIDKAKTS